MKMYQTLIAGLVACGFVFAQETTAPAAPAATEKAAPVKAAKKAAKMEATKMVAGTVVSVDAIANSIIIEKTVKAKKSEDTLNTNDKTVIKDSKGKVVTLADLASGIKVSAWYKVEDGKMVATKIMEKAIPQSKAMKAKKEVAAPAAPEAAPAAPATPAVPATPETK